MAKDRLEPAHLPAHLHSNGPSTQQVEFPTGTTIAEAERILIEQTLRDCDNDRSKAAAMLGISLRTLYNRLKQYKGGEDDEL